MKTFIKTISKNPALVIGIGIVTFIGYSQLKGHVEETSLANKVIKKGGSVSFVDGRYRVDTSFIRNDLNKTKLIADLEKQKLEEKKTVQEVPAFIWHFLGSLSLDKKFEMVNPGEDYKTGIANFGHTLFIKTYDSVIKDTVVYLKGDGAILPDKQLVYFGISDSTVLMSYYHGALQQKIIILKHHNEVITDFWYGGTWYDESAKDKASILKNLKSNRQNGC